MSPRRNRAGLMPTLGAGSTALVTAVVSSVVVIATSGGALPVGGAPAGGRLIVIMEPGAAPALKRVVDEAGGHVLADYSRLDMMLVAGPTSLTALLRHTEGVAATAPDAAVPLLSDDAGHSDASDDDGAAEPQPGSLANVTRFTGATTLWRRGLTGAGIDIAVIDTGVTPVRGLRGVDKVVVGPDLSFDSQTAGAQHLDGYGHGTAMAGIIAGREGRAADGVTYARRADRFYGMAPDARLVSIKAGDANGAVDVSQLIAAISWVTEYGDDFGLNVRVLNLSLGLDSAADPLLDPLSWAAERAWLAGVVVVASAGNGGESGAGLASPAYNPRVLAVGASDPRGTADPADDTVPGFSAIGGGSVAPDRSPDVVAPGVGIVSLASPGSTLSQTFPAARVADGLLRGSGTSQAAAVVSGAAALLLQQRPELSPDQVKELLRSTATPLPAVDAQAQGAGTIDLVAAAQASAPHIAAPAAPAATGTGSLEAARGGAHVLADGVPLTGEVDVWGTAWSLTGWSDRGSTFNGTPVAGVGFTAASTAAGRRTTLIWEGRKWADHGWSAQTWTNSTFAGRKWAENSWAGAFSRPFHNAG